MKKIVLLTSIILIFLSINFSLNPINAYNTEITNWITVTIDGVNFKIPPEYENGSLNGFKNTTYMLETVFDFSISSMYSETRLENEYGYESTNDELTTIDTEKVGKHEVILLHSYRHICKHNVTYAFFVVNKTVYSISYNGFNLTKNLKKMIKNTPKSNMSKKEFYKRLNNAQHNYLKNQEEYDEYYDYTEYRSSIKENYKHHKYDFADYYLAYRLGHHFMNKKY